MVVERLFVVIFPEFNIRSSSCTGNRNVFHRRTILPCNKSYFCDHLLDIIKIMKLSHLYCIASFLKLKSIVFKIFSSLAYLST